MILGLKYRECALHNYFALFLSRVVWGFLICLQDSEATVLTSVVLESEKETGTLVIAQVRGMITYRKSGYIRPLDGVLVS